MRSGFVTAVLAAFGVVTAAFGDRILQAPEVDAFRAIPGERELSGRLIVHLTDRDTFIARGPGFDAQRWHAARNRLQPQLLRHDEEVNEFIVRVPAGLNDRAFAHQLQQTGDYDYVVPDWLVSAVVIPDDQLLVQQWYVNQINAPIAWDITTGTADVIVAVCDSGIDLDHPDLQMNLVPGFNAPNELAQIDGGEVDGLTAHGTQVAGAAGAIGNNGIGVAGLAWNIGLMPIRVRNLPDNQALISDINLGARWAVENGATIINASFSGVQNISVQNTGEYIRERGGHYVWAAGNSNFSLNFDHPAVVIVGATDQSDQKADFSNFGPAIDIVAPGVGIWMTGLNGGYGPNSGTSFAAPITAGVLALIRSANPTLSPSDAEAILLQTAVDLGSSGEDNVFGFGRVDAAAAVALASGALNEPIAPFAISDTAYSFDATPITIDVLANDSDLNGDDLTIAAVDAVTAAGNQVAIDSDQLLFTPQPDFRGIDSFTYTVTDGRLTDTATVSIGIAEQPAGEGLCQIALGGGTPRMLAVGDFNNDARTDFVAASIVTFRITENLGDGLLQPHPLINPQINSFFADGVAAIDLNKDNRDEILLWDTFADALAIIHLNDALGLQAVDMVDVDGPQRVVVHDAHNEPLDFNNDQLSDVMVLGNVVGNEVTVMFGNGAGGFSGSLSLSGFPGFISIVDIAAGDIDSDNDTDIVSVNTLGTVHVLRNDGGGAFTADPLITTASTTRAMTLSDYDNDNDLDLLTAGVGSSDGIQTPTLRVLINNSGQLNPVPEVLSAAGDAATFQLTDLIAADLNGDAIDEYTMVQFQGLTRQYETVINFGTGLVMPVSINTPIDAFSAHALVQVDIDDDGDHDTVVLATSNAFADVLDVRWNGTFDGPHQSADITCDALVNGADLLRLLNDWGDCPEPLSCPADLSGDGAVSGPDLLLLLNSWG